MEYESCVQYLDFGRMAKLNSTICGGKNQRQYDNRRINLWISKLANDKRVIHPIRFSDGECENFRYNTIYNLQFTIEH